VGQYASQNLYLRIEVSLTCICSKILKHIIIYKHLRHHLTLCNEQSGFHKKRSCITQLISLMNCLLDAWIRLRVQCDFLLLDFSKEKSLIHCCITDYHTLHGVKGPHLGWHHFWTTDHYTYVILYNQRSETTQVLFLAFGTGPCVISTADCTNLQQDLPLYLFNT